MTDVTAADREYLRQKWESNDIYGETVNMNGMAVQLAQVWNQLSSWIISYWMQDFRNLLISSMIV